MKTKLFIFFIPVILTFNLNCYSQGVKAPYEVGTWYGFRSSAISYTFDDGLPNQYSVAVPLFDKYGFKLTLFTVTGWAPNWSKIRNAAANGHEVANHTVTHPNFDTMTVDQQRAELEVSNDSIHANVPGLNGLTLAYPFCVPGSDTLVSRLFIGARGCSGVIEPKTPANFMNISSIGCGNLGSINSTAAFKAKADNAASSKGWLVYLIHAIDNDNGYSPLTSTCLDSSLLYLKNNESKFWVESFGNVVRYIRERNCLTVQEKSSTDTLITIAVTDTLNNEIFNYPVSIRRVLPDNWSSARAFQNGKSIIDTLFEIDSVKYIEFHVIPDSGDVLLSRMTALDVQQSESSFPKEYYFSQNYPNPFNPSTTISFYLPSNYFVSLKVFDIVGREVTEIVSEELSSGFYSRRWNAEKMSSGVYFYRMQAGSFTETKKLILLR
jgi:hypothetical protein